MMPSIFRFFKRIFFKSNSVISWDIEIPEGDYAIISDNHGFLDVYNEILKEIYHHNVLGIFHAGDICGPGPSSIECIKKTIESNIMAVKGNHDRFFLGLDSIHKYKNQYAAISEQYRIKAKKTEPKIFKKFLQLPEKIKTNYFEIVHNFYMPPYYACNHGKSNADFVYLNKIERPVFMGSDHEFYILQKVGINIQKEYLPFGKEIVIQNPCIIGVPSMNYSKDKDLYLHGYLIVSIISDSENTHSIHSHTQRERERRK